MLSAIGLSVTALLLSGLSEQSLYPGSCSSYNIPAVQPFLPATLSPKTWYLIATDDVGLPYHNFDCIRFFDVTVIGTGHVKTKESAKNLATNQFETNISSMDFRSFDGNYIYRTSGAADQATKIILTDSLTYYVEISCVDEGGEANLYVGIFSSLRALSSTTLDGIYKFLEGYNIKSTNLRFVEQRVTRCGY